MEEIFYIDEEYLAHHGIKGQKWGVRRYRNKDGSLTEKGRMRYSDAENAYKDRLKFGKLRPEDREYLAKAWKEQENWDKTLSKYEPKPGIIKRVFGYTEQFVNTTVNDPGSVKELIGIGKDVLGYKEKDKQREEIDRDRAEKRRELDLNRDKLSFEIEKYRDHRDNKSSKKDESKSEDGFSKSKETIFGSKTKKDEFKSEDGSSKSKETIFGSNTKKESGSSDYSSKGKQETSRIIDVYFDKVSNSWKAEGVSKREESYTSNAIALLDAGKK